MKVFLGIAAVCMVLNATAHPSVAHAQSEPPSIALDFGLGVMSGKGGEHSPRNGVAANAQLIFAARDLPRGSLLLGLGASSARATFGGSVDCVVPETNPESGCLSAYPAFNSLGVLGGWSTEGRVGSFRVLLGPSFAHALKVARPGFDVRADVATPPFAQLSLTAWTAAMVVPNLAGSRYTILSIGLGVRIR